MHDLRIPIRAGSGPGPASAPADAGRGGDADRGLQHERRDERHFIRVPVPFSAEVGRDATMLPGSDLSMGGFSVGRGAEFETGTVVPVSLLIAAGAAQLIVPADARVLRSSDGETAFEFTRIDDRHREVLRRVIRAHLSGRYVAVEDMVDDEDPQTPRKRAAASAAAAAAARHDSRPKPWGRYAALGAAAVALVAVAGATAYRNFMLIDPDFAAVTAPRVDIRAPGDGVLGEHNLQAGDRVERDTLLVRVVDSDLRTDLMLARAAYRYNERLIGNLEDRLSQPQVEQVSMAESAGPPEDGAARFDMVPAEIARARIDEFQTARDFEVSKIAALEARMAANEIYSPCNCLVAWARSAAGGSYIDKSERIITLIKTGPEDLLVEALVHMSEIDRIEPHQRAYVALPNASEPIAARVHAVSLDVERQPRAGFPKWVRQQQNVASVLLVPEEPLPASAVGVPVDVRFSEAPVIDATAEWVWQGGRAVAQQVATAAQAAWSTVSGAAHDAAQETGIPLGDGTSSQPIPREAPQDGGTDTGTGTEPPAQAPSSNPATPHPGTGDAVSGTVPEQTAAVPGAPDADGSGPATPVRKPAPPRDG